MIGEDLDIRIHTATDLDEETEDKIVESVGRALREAGIATEIKDDVLKECIEIGDERKYKVRILFTVLEQLLSAEFFDDSGYDVIDTATSVYSPIDLFFGNLEILNNILSREREIDILSIWAKLYTYRLERMKEISRELLKTKDGLKLLKRLYEFACMRGKENEFRYLIDEYRKGWQPTQIEGVTLVYKKALEKLDVESFSDSSLREDLQRFIWRISESLTAALRFIEIYGSDI